MSQGISARLADVVHRGRTLLEEISSVGDEEWIDYSDVGLYEEWLAEAGDLLLAIGGPDSDPFGQFRRIVNSQRNPVGVKSYVVRQVFDLMLSVLEEWSRGSLRRFEDIVASTILDELLDHAAAYRATERKIECAALAGTALDQALRRVAAKYGLDVSGKDGETLLGELEAGDVFDEELERRLRKTIETRRSIEAADWTAVEPRRLEAMIADARTLLADFI